MEAGTKQLALSKNDAYDFFEKSFKLYTLFWGLNMGALMRTRSKKNRRRRHWQK